MYDITVFGYNPAPLENPAYIPARVVAVYKERYELVSANGHGYGRLKHGVYYGGSEEFPTTGDFVLTLSGEGGDDVIAKTLPRKSFFSRREPGPIPREQAVAANFDYVFLLSSLNQDFNVRRMERYLTQAWQSGGLPVIVLTKADLSDSTAEQIQMMERAAPGVPLFAVSAKNGLGMDALSAYLKPRETVVLLGSSGVGKSSLVNALAGRELMEEGGIRESDGRGRHTTTHRQLLMLESGVMIIDTPGMRSLGMWDVTEGLGGAFEDVERFLGQCRFSDCKHQSEPGCAVMAAIAAGELLSDRLDSYNKLKREARFSENKLAAQRERAAQGKAISKWIKQYKKGGG